MYKIIWGKKKINVLKFKNKVNVHLSKIWIIKVFLLSNLKKKIHKYIGKNDKNVQIIRINAHINHVNLVKKNVHTVKTKKDNNLFFMILYAIVANL